MKKYFYSSFLFFILLLGYGCNSEQTNAKIDLIETEAKKMIEKQTSGFFTMEGFELLDSKTTKHKKKKLFNKTIPANNNHYFHFKTNFVVVDDCNKAVIHFKNQDKNLFYNLETVALDELCFNCKGQERLFKGDVYEVTCSFRYYEYEKRDEFTPIKVDNMQYKRIKDGEERKNFTEETYRTVTFMDRHNHAANR